MSDKKLPVNYEHPKFVAFEVLEKYNFQNPPIDIRRVAADYGIDIVEIDFPNDVGHISGMLDIESKTIFLNIDDADTRKAFTVAHELGHYIMHKKILENDDSYSVVFRKENFKKDNIEREADVFAANLLTPKFLMDKFIDKATIKQLAEMFGVSIQMMEYRIAREYKTINNLEL